MSPIDLYNSYDPYLTDPSSFVEPAAEAADEAIEKELQLYLSSMRELLTEMKQPKNRFEFQNILSLLQEVIELQEQEAAMTTYYFQETHKDNKSLRDQRLKKMEEIANYAKPSKTWGVITTTASVLQMGATVSFTSPLGVYALPLALGMAVDKMLDDPVKKALIYSVFGENEKAKEKSIQLIDVGFALLSACLSFGAVGFNPINFNLAGFNQWVSTLSSTAQATTHTTKGIFSLQTKNAEAALTGYEEKSQAAMAKEKRLNKELERIMDNWANFHQNSHEVLRRLSQATSAILRI